jgi:hypothetical protein
MLRRRYAVKVVRRPRKEQTPCCVTPQAQCSRHRNQEKIHRVDPKKSCMRARARLMSRLFYRLLQRRASLGRRRVGRARKGVSEVK